MPRNNEKPVTVRLKPIGVIHSEHKVAEDTPIQPFFAQRCRGKVVVFPEYAKGLKDIESFSHLILLYHFHKTGQTQLVVKPFLDDKPHGIFACRHPHRPNGIGLSIVKLVRRRGRALYVEGVDILDGTPLLDIKPYFRQFDRPEKTSGGWLENIDSKSARRKGLRGYKHKGVKKCV